LVDGTSYVTLVPVGPDSLGGISYMVYQVNRDTLEMEPVIHQSGELEGLAFQVSTAEESILNVIQLDQASQAQRDMEYGQMIGGVIEQPMELAPSLSRAVGEAMTADFVPDEGQIADLEDELSILRNAASQVRSTGGLRLIQRDIRELEATRLEWLRQYNSR
jgi:hypothetical protein